ncbi:hypothetical protein ACHAWC_011749 [Mediolabrus comicus]
MVMQAQFLQLIDFFRAVVAKLGKAFSSHLRNVVIVSVADFIEERLLGFAVDYVSEESVHGTYSIVHYFGGRSIALDAFIVKIRNAFRNALK